MNISSYTNLVSLHLNTKFVDASHPWTIDWIHTALQDVSHSTCLERISIAFSITKYQASSLAFLNWETIDRALSHLARIQMRLRDVVFVLRVLEQYVMVDTEMLAKEDIFARLPKSLLADAPLRVVCRSVDAFSLDTVFEME